MREYFIWAGIALCLFSLWQLAKRDWVRLTRPRSRVLAEVTGHRSHYEDGSRSWSAVFAFETEGGRHEVVDQLYESTKRLPVGHRLELVYPQGRPDLARLPRPLLWLAVYALLIALPAVLFAAFMGWLR